METSSQKEESMYFRVKKKKSRTAIRKSSKPDMVSKFEWKM